MQIYFRDIEIEGFMSIGKAFLDFIDNGMVLVEGLNQSEGTLQSNGSGKSCLFEAIYWVLSGKTIRGTKDIINEYYMKNYAVVKLVMSVNNSEYCLIRHKNHPEHRNNLLIYRDGENISGEGIKKSEKTLYSELPFLTEDLIGSVIILGQGLPSKFTSFEPARRKEMLEVLSGSSGVVEAMKETITKYRDHLSGQISDINIKKGSLESILTLRKMDLESLKNKQGDSSIDVKKETAKLQELKDKKEVIGEEVNELFNSLEDIKGKFNTKHSEKYRLEIEIRGLQESIADCKKDLSAINDDKCPTCGQVLSQPGQVVSREEMKKGLITKIENFKKSLSDNKSDVMRLQRDLERLQSKHDKVDVLYKNKKKSLDKIDGDISVKMELLQGVKDYSDDIERIEEEIKKGNRDLLKLGKDLDGLLVYEDIAGYCLRELGREFRSYLLTGVVNYLNDVIKDYATELFGKPDLKIVLDDNKIYIIYEGRNYESLSGGERHRADLCMQFCLREMLINTIGFRANIIVLDEVFDNLDANGIDALTKTLLNKMSNIDSMFVVTHSPSLPIPYDKKIKVVKNKSKVSEIVVNGG